MHAACERGAGRDVDVPAALRTSYGGPEGSDPARLALYAESPARRLSPRGRRQGRDDQEADRRAAESHQRRRSEEHTSELQSLMRISYAVFCLKKKKKQIYKTEATAIQQKQKNIEYNTS